MHNKILIFLKVEILSIKINKKTMKIKKPNFLLAGAPKCGTTSMYYYLKQHPDIFLSEHKEPNYFAKDIIMPHNPIKNNKKAYENLFKNAKNEKIIGEGSTMYFYSEVAAKEIKKNLGKIKILIMLRNPIDMMYSQHSQKVYEGIEKEENFEKALLLKKQRKTKPIKVTIKTINPKLVSYRYIANYPKHVKKYTNLFGKNNVKVVILEEFKKKPKKIYNEILKFLDLESPDFEIDFSVKNPNKMHRIFLIKKLQKILFANLSSKIKKIMRPIYPQKLFMFINELNTKEKKREPLSHEVREKIYRQLSSQIKDLEKILDKNLSIWKL